MTSTIIYKNYNNYVIWAASVEKVEFED